MMLQNVIVMDAKLSYFFSAIKLQIEPQYKSINLLPMCASGLLEMVICKLQKVM